ncbi:hypothetical protein Pmar_PMAR023033 [Perkinsus marinus ATCC 50983]|uniref:Uncharacterized protein n=1 Tax=Perkinsus marinus (strain ATCC 50983 / TXsc) TaxID=423536 RepID=C5LHY1_PERM5|nr:hypothetical protein Pmar_PMAR023033 [Perkinsus marinus ATCC 50983]EER03735.1 hypothetical protein Pmar_PMAR023033 [Perkinsus marinus ATCC 50983]|eukprot:XP_002771919.1 hypothetical protein Pmar_PMAR023033 [Perkinsus marinus ATCC 50983]
MVISMHLLPCSCIHVQEDHMGIEGFQDIPRTLGRSCYLGRYGAGLGLNMDHPRTESGVDIRTDEEED